MNILIIEPHMNGHHGAWLQWLVPGLMERGHGVLVGTLESSRKHPSFTSWNDNVGKQPGVVTVPDSKSYLSNGVSDMVRREFAYRALFGKIFENTVLNHRLDGVFVPYLDYCTYALAVAGAPFGGMPWAGVMMRQSFHHADMGINTPARRMDRIKKFLFLRLLSSARYLKGILTVDPLLRDYLVARHPELEHRIDYLPDPSPSKVSISHGNTREHLGIPGSAMVILVYGGITLRKGVDILLHALQDAGMQRSVHVLLVGKQDEDVRRFLNSSTAAATLREQKRLHEMDRYVGSDEENTAFAVADMVWMGYRDHYQMSGVLVKAGLAGLPVIACHEGLIGWLTARHETGLIVRTTNMKEIADAISHLVERPELMRKYGENGRRVFAKHTVSHAVEIISRHLEEK